MKDLSELLVSLSLGALVIAGALQMHTAFVRQSREQAEVSEIQQTLRVSMRVVEAAVRRGGAGGRVVENDEGQCEGPPRTLPPLVWSDGTLRIVAARAEAPILVSGDGGGDLSVVSGDAARVGDGDLVQVLTPAGPCTRRISSGERHERALPHDPAGAAGCFDPQPATDRCLSRCSVERPCPLRRLGTTEFRLSGKRLQTRAGVGWTTVAEGVDAFDVVFLCTEAGACDGARAAALRVTLKARGRTLSEVIALRNVS